MRMKVCFSYERSLSVCASGVNNSADVGCGRSVKYCKIRELLMCCIFNVVTFIPHLVSCLLALGLTRMNGQKTGIWVLVAAANRAAFRRSRYCVGLGRRTRNNVIQSHRHFEIPTKLMPLNDREIL